MSTSDYTANLKCGEIVIASRALDPEGACVKAGEMGFVFRERNFYGDDAGPMVRWMSGGCCNIYRGDVVVPSEATTPEDIVQLFDLLQAILTRFEAEHPKATADEWDALAVQIELDVRRYMHTHHPKA